MKIMNEIQKKHIEGELDVYAPIEAYYVKWHHDPKGNNHHPIEETRVRKDLPCIAQQWKDDYNRRRKPG